MSHPEAVGVVLFPLGALGGVRAVLIEAEAKLRELHGFCDGCDCPSSRCGPELWRQERKCCPDCTHGRRRGNGC